MARRDYKSVLIDKHHHEALRQIWLSDDEERSMRQLLHALIRKEARRKGVPVPKAIKGRRQKK